MRVWSDRELLYCARWTVDQMRHISDMNEEPGTTPWYRARQIRGLLEQITVLADRLEQEQWM